MRYIVKKIREKSEIESCETFFIDQYMWNSKQEPKTYGWMGYLENEGFYVKMICEEKDPKRGWKNHKEMVCEDSAVEVFLAFTEENEILTNNSMYINFEINANGAMYAQYGKGRKNRQFLSEEEYRMANIRTKMSENQWEMEVTIPETFLNKICDLEKIKSGKLFYCNFYKISEDASIEHYGSYSPIDSEVPNFHLPVFFAEAILE